MEFVTKQHTWLAMEGKIDQIDPGFEVGIIESSGQGWHYARLADRSSEDSVYSEPELRSPLQKALTTPWLLADPDWQPDIHGSIDAQELCESLTPMISQCGEIEVHFLGDQVEF